MHRLTYVPATSSTPIELDGSGIFAQGGASGIRGRIWARSLGYRNLLQANRPAREESLTVYASFAQADKLRRAADADVQARKPGTLVFDGWRQSAYILESAPKPYYHGVMLELTVALMGGAWWMLFEKQFPPASELPSDSYLDYPYDYEYDFAASYQAGEVDTGLLTAAPVRLIIYGPATNPYIVVGSNRYQVNTTIASGAHVIVDGLAKTITHVSQNGDSVDIFAAGVRGSGQGGGSYVFEPIPAGVESVSWDGSFGFDLGWYDLEGEPPWNLS